MSTRVNGYYDLSSEIYLNRATLFYFNCVYLTSYYKKSIKQRIGNAPNAAKIGQPQNNSLKQKDLQQGQKTNVKSRIDLAARLSLNGIPLRKNARANAATNLRGRVQAKGGFTPKKNEMKRVTSGGNITKNRLRSMWLKIWQNYNLEFLNVSLFFCKNSMEERRRILTKKGKLNILFE